MTLGSTTYNSLSVYKGATGNDQHSSPQTYFVITDGGGSDGNNGLTSATAWATTARADSQLLTTGQAVAVRTGGVWTEYRVGPYNPNNLFNYSEPLLANLVLQSANVTQASFTENGLTNGIQFPAVNETDYAYVLESQMQPNTTYTISVYAVRSDAQPVTGNEFKLRFSGTSVTPTNVQLVSGSLYRVSATSTTGSSVTANANGILRSGNAIGFRVSGYQINLGATLQPYTKKP